MLQQGEKNFASSFFLSLVSMPLLVRALCVQLKHTQIVLMISILNQDRGKDTNYSSQLDISSHVDLTLGGNKWL